MTRTEDYQVTVVANVGIFGSHTRRCVFAGNALKRPGRGPTTAARPGIGEEPKTTGGYRRLQAIAKVRWHRAGMIAGIAIPPLKGGT